MMYEKVSELTRESMYKQGKAIKKKKGETIVMGKEEVMEDWMNTFESHLGTISKKI